MRTVIFSLPLVAYRYAGIIWRDDGVLRNIFQDADPTRHPSALSRGTNRFFITTPGNEFRQRYSARPTYDTSQIAIRQQECAFFHSRATRKGAEGEHAKRRTRRASPSLSSPSYREIARCQNFLICRSGTTEQSAGTIYPPERKGRDFIGSRGIAFQPRKPEYRDSDEAPPVVLGRVESDATNSRLTFFSSLSIFFRTSLKKYVFSCRPEINDGNANHLKLQSVSRATTFFEILRVNLFLHNIARIIATIAWKQRDGQTTGGPIVAKIYPAAIKYA